MIKSFVAADLGVSLVSSSFAADDVIAGRVKLLDLEGPELWRELGIAYRRDRTLSVASKTFVGVVRQLSEHLK
jgi:DNA-binding transcriptional LysR family regulator